MLLCLIYLFSPSSRGSKEAVVMGCFSYFSVSIIAWLTVLGPLDAPLHTLIAWPYFSVMLHGCLFKYALWSCAAA
jgi:membrane protein required for beta-lactamase induction